MKLTDKINDVGVRIKQVRQKLEMTQEEFSKYTGIHKSQIGNYETGVSKPKYPELIIIAVKGKVTINWLLLGDDQAEIINPGTVVNEETVQYNARTETPELFNIDLPADQLTHDANIKRKLICDESIPDTALWEVDTNRYAPEVNEGDDILIHINMEPMNGDLVYCGMKNGRYLLGRFNRITEAGGETVIITTVGELSYNQRLKPEEIDNLYRIMKVYPKPKTY